MKLAEIMQLALRQLDEDPADISDYDDLFRRYANEGYQIVMRDHYKPRTAVTLETDEHGAASLEGLDIVRVIELRDGLGRDVWFDLAPDCKMVFTRVRSQALTGWAEEEIPMLTLDGDEPQFPEWAHSCLADYICYRHLSAGNMAKQSKAQFWLQSFYQTVRRLRPVGQGSVTRAKRLYAVTDARYTRW